MHTNVPRPFKVLTPIHATFPVAKCQKEAEDTTGQPDPIRALLFDESGSPLKFTGCLASPAFKKAFQKYAIVSEGEGSVESGYRLLSSARLEELNGEDGGYGRSLQEDETGKIEKE